MTEIDLFAKLPDNVIEQIFSYLTLKDLAACSLVCKSWKTYLR
jgi:hypothetical protein